MTTLETLAAKGWHIKILSDHTQPNLCWRCWMSWRKGKLPHREECCRQDTLKEIAAWCLQTEKDWKWE